MHLPLYRHPCLTVLVDDSDSFLRSLSFQLAPALASKSFHDTSSALDWMRRQSPSQAAPLAQISASYDLYPGGTEQCNVGVDVEQIHRISLQPQRFATPSVLVVDYSMPQMNGVEFCQALRDLPCKKILFTGAADEKIAVDAFNRGLIDRYIKKSDDDALDKLEAQILELQQEYFAAQSDTLRELLTLHNYGFISDPAFAQVLQQASREHRIVEYYLYPNPAGLLLYDELGKARLLVVETDDSMQSHHEMARDSDAPVALLAALEARCVIPFFRTADRMYAPALQRTWHRHCEAARSSKGRQTYYWALFDLQDEDLPERPRAFADFLREHGLRN